MSHQMSDEVGRGLLSGSTVVMHRHTGLQNQHFSSETTQGHIGARRRICWFGSPPFSDFCLELLYFWSLGVSDILLLAITMRDQQSLAPWADGSQEAASPHRRRLWFPKCSQPTQAQAGAKKGVPKISPVCSSAGMAAGSAGFREES